MQAVRARMQNPRVIKQVHVPPGFAHAAFLDDLEDEGAEVLFITDSYWLRISEYLDDVTTPFPL